MNKFKDKVAVVTGAASGIGLGLAEGCVREGMKVVLADIEAGSLKDIERHFRTLGADVLAVTADVSQAADVKALAEKTLKGFGGIHLLFNNAGVDVKSTIRESTLADWQWILGVNLWGVIHGVRFFTPIMLEQGTECHIVNTASTAGLYTDWCGSPYTVSKHAIVALSEILYRDLKQDHSNIGVSVLCPGPVQSSLETSQRNRPDELRNPGGGKPDTSGPKIRAYIQALTEMIEDVMSPEQVADTVFTAIREKQFYIMVNAGFAKPLVRTRMEDILEERNPTGGLPPDNQATDR